MSSTTTLRQRPAASPRAVRLFKTRLLLDSVERSDDIHEGATVRDDRTWKGEVQDRLSRALVRDQHLNEVVPREGCLVRDPERDTATHLGPAQAWITRVQYDVQGVPDHEDLNGEWVEITNLGRDEMDLGGWTLEDDAGATFTVPEGTTLRSADSIRIHTGSGDDTPRTFYWGNPRPIWNNDGDQAILRDAGGSRVDVVRW